MLNDLWYVAEWAKNIKDYSDEPLMSKVLSHELLLSRCGDGSIICYEKDGLDEKKYPVKERYGLVWVFMGDTVNLNHFPIPPVPEYGNPHWKMLTKETTWNAGFHKVMEHFLDISNIPHLKNNGQDSMPEFISIDSDRYWLKIDCEMKLPQLKGSFWRRQIRKEGEKACQSLYAWLPGFSIRLYNDLNPRMNFVLFSTNTPVDEHTTRTFMLQFRDFFKWDLFDNGSNARLQKTIDGYRAIVESDTAVINDPVVDTWRKLYNDQTLSSSTINS